VPVSAGAASLSITERHRIHKKERQCLPRHGAPRESASTSTLREGLVDRGDPEALAKEIAARTVNKGRARSGEARQASHTSTEDISSGRRGGLRSQRGSGGRTRDQLYEEASRRGVKGRSKMSKAQLEGAVDR
jgi:hypothetical protein